MPGDAVATSMTVKPARPMVLVFIRFPLRSSRNTRARLPRRACYSMPKDAPTPIPLAEIGHGARGGR